MRLSSLHHDRPCICHINLFYDRSAHIISFVLQLSRRVTSVAPMFPLRCHSWSCSFFRKDNETSIPCVHSTFYLLTIFQSLFFRLKKEDGAFYHSVRVFLTKRLLYFNSRTILVTWIKLSTQSRGIKLTRSSTANNQTDWLPESFHSAFNGSGSNLNDPLLVKNRIHWSIKLHHN